MKIVELRTVNTPTLTAPMGVYSSFIILPDQVSEPLLLQEKQQQTVKSVLAHPTLKAIAVSRQRILNSNWSVSLKKQLHELQHDSVGPGTP